MISLVDTHCHLNDPTFADSLPAVLERTRAAGVRACIVPAYDTGSLSRTAGLAVCYPGLIFPAYGLHPWFVREDPSLETLRPYLERGDAVALGEIGLDALVDDPPLALQLPSFLAQLDLAVQRDLPVLIHCRRAHEPLYQALRPHRGRLRGLLHAYSGSREQLPRFIDLGLHIAFSGTVTRPTARRSHEAAVAVPLERLLIETDAPSIATATTPASAVEPRHTVEIAQRIASLRGLSFAEVCAQTTENSQKLFGVPFS